MDAEQVVEGQEADWQVERGADHRWVEMGVVVGGDNERRPGQGGVVFDPECEGGPAGDPDHRLAHTPEDFGSEELGLGHGVKLVDGPLIDGASIVDCKCVGLH
jgi:hypothetical protein